MKRVTLTLLACVALALSATTASAQGYSRRQAHSGHDSHFGASRARTAARFNASHFHHHQEPHRRSVYKTPPCFDGYRSHGYTNRGPTDFFYSPSQHGYRGYGR